MARILVAEDDAHIIRVLTLWLKQHGHEVIEAVNGQEALDRLEETTVDMLISDMNMPRVDGLQLVKIVREQRKLTMPILMLSSRCDQRELSEQTQPLGVHLFPKPFVPSRIVMEIERLLNGVPACEIECG